MRRKKSPKVGMKMKQFGKAKKRIHKFFKLMLK
jgi:hypothetical protein